MQGRTTTHQLRTRRNEGFTIVELLIVIVVIAILAALVIVAYNGIRTRAIETSMQSDLHTAATLLTLDYTDAGAYPADASSVDSGRGLRSSNGTELTYVTKPYGYCVAATNPATNKTFAVRSSTGLVGEGTCDLTVTTLAGSGASGGTNGSAAAATFDYPSDVAVDSSGNVFVAEDSGNRIRKITPDGIVSTLAGNGTAGSANGTGAAARFDRPYGIVIDTSDMIYVSEVGNHRIRRITQAGTVTTFAGSSSGYANGTGTAARFNYPYGLAVDTASNTFYIGDAWNFRVRKITATGVVTAFAGSGTQGYADGTGTAARFRDLDGMAVDSAGNVYVADYSDHRIRKITPGGVVTTLAGSGTAGYADGSGTAARFNSPRDVAVDAAGNVYVSDEGNNRLRMISPAGVVTTVAGNGTAGYADGPGANAMFRYIGGIDIDASGIIYVADADNNRIRKIQP